MSSMKYPCSWEGLEKSIIFRFYHCVLIITLHIIIFAITLRYCFHSPICHIIIMPFQTNQCYLCSKYNLKENTREIKYIRWYANQNAALISIFHRNEWTFVCDGNKSQPKVLMSLFLLRKLPLIVIDNIGCKKICLHSGRHSTLAVSRTTTSFCK